MSLEWAHALSSPTIVEVTVYVDQPRLYGSYKSILGRRVNRPHLWCHLWADTVEELHAFAARLDMRLEWFQDRPRFPHYDLMGERKRRQAVQLGAKEMTREDFLRRISLRWWD